MDPRFIPKIFSKSVSNSWRYFNSKVVPLDKNRDRVRDTDRDGDRGRDKEGIET
jgi:hypothetical protein